MATAEDAFKVEKLTGDNYHSWKFNMKMYLIGKDLWEIVTGTEMQNADASAEEERKYRRRENMALATVCLSISTNLQIYVRSCKTAKDAWDSLAKHFEQKTLSRKIFYRRKLYSARMQKGTGMVEHINYIKTLSEHLEAVEDPIEEKDLVIILISSLPEDYNYLITALETIAEEKLTWDYVRDRLIYEADKIKSGPAEKTETFSDALFTRKSDQRKFNDLKNFKCHYCQKRGHFARDCFKKKADTKKSQNVGHKEHIFKKEAQSGNFVRNEDDNNGGNSNPDVALAAKAESAKENWWIDSGASKHMTPKKTSLVNFQKFLTPSQVKLADNSILYSYGKGDVYLTVYDGAEKVNVVLKDVLYVPKLQNKLLSLASMTEKGASVEFKGKSCKITIDNKSYSIGHKHGKLYKLNLVPEGETSYLGIAEPENSLSLWHLRYGHLGYDNIKLLSSKAMVDGMTINLKEEFDRNECEGCAMGKMHRKPFPKKSQHRSTQPLQLIHSDICGPMNVKSVGGSRYFVTFIDDFSRFTHVYMIQNKSEVLDKFQEFVQLTENLMGYRVKALRSDNAQEYKSMAFMQYCKEKGIRKDNTIPYTPEHNGVAERMNRTIMETARSMLYHAHLPLNFWAEAVSTAIYLRNRSPTSYLNDMTPYEAWFKERPNVSNIKVYGCKAYVHVPDQKRRKLDKKSIACVFIGYPNNSKGYKLYDLETKKMIRSRDVTFLETNFDHKLPDCRNEDQMLLTDEESVNAESMYFDHNIDAANDEYPYENARESNQENIVPLADNERPQRNRVPPID